ncbi:hypothetical protein Tsubulata_033750 [Turnera subulata]|uniref:Uncharacterized protein n=1 Tax=Turnera subulata TaxID=218843 RepID=A0A9Q0FY17_9ROSI|nr:hypothetical protein Tsubulata_033750 [Turnera subulata]
MSGVSVTSSSALVGIRCASSPPTTTTTTCTLLRRSKCALWPLTTSPLHPFVLRATNDSNGGEKDQLSSSDEDDDPAIAQMLEEGDRIVDGMEFGELCNEFECISSPLVESTARQLVRDILQLRTPSLDSQIFAVSVKYKDPVRSFTGREKYNRPLWATNALQNPTVTVQEMVMQSTSVLSIKWTITGKLNSFVGDIGGQLIIKVHSVFTLNQISGQVIEHEEVWDLSASSPVGQVFFWTSRTLFSTVEGGKDLNHLIKSLARRFSAGEENRGISSDAYGDPTKFFQRDDGLQNDAYQIALFLAIVYFVVQFLRITL